MEIFFYKANLFSLLFDSGAESVLRNEVEVFQFVFVGDGNGRPVRLQVHHLRRNRRKRRVKFLLGKSLEFEIF